MPVTAVQLLKNEVLPTFKEQKASIDAVLSDNGRGLCGREDLPRYELFQLKGIEHKRKLVRWPHSTGIDERLHHTLLDEHFREKGRKTSFGTIEEMQFAFNACLPTIPSGHTEAAV